MRPLRLVTALAAALAAALSYASVAHTAPPTPNHCLTPGGVDLNQLLGIKETIVGPPACREVRAGQRWVIDAAGWGTAADAATAVYPAGYVPQEPDPIDDFNAKFRGARWVLDAGTPQQNTITAGPEVLRTGFFGPDGQPFSLLPSPVLRPLPVGGHTFTIYLTLSAQHCDGLGTVVEANCLPAGKSLWFPQTTFEVVARYGTPGRP